MSEPRMKCLSQSTLARLTPTETPTDCASDDRVEKIEKALRELPQGQRDALLLTKTADLSVKEAARVLGSSEGAVKVKVHRALQTIRRLLNGAAAEMEGKDGGK